jgi:hypothetical protein
MEMIPVASSNLAAIGYEIETAILRVQFNHGGVYDYQGVSEDIYDGFVGAPSKGQYFERFIKKGGYPFVKVG